MTTTRLELYTPYERLWHWLQALGIGMLIVTGILIHAPEMSDLISFQSAVLFHNILGFVLVGNAVFGILYYVVTGSIRQYMPDPNDFVTMSLRQIKYYTIGIFRGDPHPLEKSPFRRLNPLQQITYLAILNILLPVQIVTGLLMYSGQYWPESVAMLGGVAGLSMIHLGGAWLFVAFVIAHMYLTTTGQKPLSNIKAMIVGYEDVDEDEFPHQETSPPAGEAAT